MLAIDIIILLFSLWCFHCSHKKLNVRSITISPTFPTLSPTFPNPIDLKSERVYYLSNKKEQVFKTKVRHLIDIRPAFQEVRMDGREESLLR